MPCGAPMVGVLQLTRWPGGDSLTTPNIEVCTGHTVTCHVSRVHWPMGSQVTRPQPDHTIILPNTQPYQLVDVVDASSQ